MESNEMKYQLKAPEAFIIIDADSGKISWGGNQEWYHTKWQRLSGCGPTTVTNIFRYLTKNIRSDDDIPVTRKAYQAAMEAIWKYVTPTIHGIPTATLLLRRVPDLLAAHGYTCRLDQMDIVPPQCPDLPTIEQFLKRYLQNDIPVALLTLDHGQETALDEWHWVTIIAMDDVHENDLEIVVIDNGEQKEVNLGLWLTTTKKGGGLAAFSIT